MGNVRPDKGVFKRKGSDVWQHRIFIPADLRERYGDRSVLAAKSLGTKDLTEANRRARVRVAEYEMEFAAHRRGTGSSHVRTGKPALTRQMIEANGREASRRTA